MTLNRTSVFTLIVVLALLLTACGASRITVVEKTTDALGQPALVLQTCQLDESDNIRSETCTFKTISVSQDTWDRNSVGSEYQP